ncbi:MAG: EamA family transporter, partial [Pseudomonadota bacterium]
AYTVVFRLSGLTAYQGAAISIGWSAMLVVPVALWLGVETGSADWPEIALVTFIQGVLGGAVALVTFGVAVSLLGPSRTAAFTALTPVVVLVASVFFLAEPIDSVKVAGILIVSAGVFLASGVIREGVR